MARDHARIYVSIWSDPDFRALPVSAQHLYLMALSQPRLSYCGVMDYLPNRLAKLSDRATPRTVAMAVKVLKANAFILTDEETGELLLRSFVRHDGLLSSPNMTKAMAKDYRAVLSDELRYALDEELRRAHDEAPELAGWKALENAYPEVYSKATGKGFRKGSRKGSANG